MMSSKNAFLSLMAMSSLVCGLASATTFADDQFSGNLQVNVGSSINLSNTKKGSSGSVALQSGPVQVTVSGKGWFNGPGSLVINTATGIVKLKIYNSAYSSGDNFLAHGDQAGQPYNIQGIHTTTQSAAPQTTQVKSCSVPPEKLTTSVDLGKFMPPACSSLSANGQPIDPNAAPATDYQNVGFDFCEAPADKAGAMSKISVVQSDGNCPGTQVETDQVVTTVNHYELDFIDSNGKTIAVINSDDGGSSSNQFVSQTDCQPL